MLAIYIAHHSPQKHHAFELLCQSRNMDIGEPRQLPQTRHDLLLRARQVKHLISAAVNPALYLEFLTTGHESLDRAPIHDAPQGCLSSSERSVAKLSSIDSTWPFLAGPLRGEAAGSRDRGSGVGGLGLLSPLLPLVRRCSCGVGGVEVVLLGEAFEQDLAKEAEVRAFTDALATGRPGKTCRCP